MAKILSAKPYIDTKMPELKARCAALKERGVYPKLAVVLVGDNPASLSYVKNKQRMCEQVGALFELRHLAPSISPLVFQATLNEINHDPSIHGCIIQLPVAGECSKLPLEAQVKPDKDVDGFHPFNTSELYLGRVNEKSLIPCTPKGIVNLLRFYQIPLRGKHAVVIGRSQIVGKPLSLLLNREGATVTNCHSQTPDLTPFTRSADLVISAVGKIDLLKASHFDPHRKTVVIDVGINKNSSGKIVGDVAFSEVEPLVSAITPVPGGIGPMTVISLIENLLTAAHNFFHRGLS
jgi:methylenetetrahydrofolate dehydrogenase (NADP+) / methenyltetrahydrofolate cyclohydrolase